MAARAGGRGLGLGDRAAAGRGGRTGAAAPGQQTSEGGGGGFAQGLGFFRTVGGEDMSAKLAFIAAHMAEHAVRLMCRVLGVSRSWFHAWQRAAPTRAERAARRGVLVAEVREIFEASRQRYGAPRVHADLQARGRQISKRTVAKLMKQTAFGRPAGTAACQSPPTVGTRTPWRQTCSTVTSRSPFPTRCGWLTSATFPPTRVGSTLPR